MLTTSKIDSFDELVNLKEVWNALADHLGNVFLSHEWVSNWWQCFGKDKQLYLLVVKDDKNIVGIAPLMISKLPLGIKKLEFIGTPLSDYNDFIILGNNEEVLKAIDDYLQEHKSDWSFIKLRQIPENSKTVHHQFSGRYYCTDCDVCPGFLFKQGWEADCTLMNARSLRKSLNQLRAKGMVTLASCKGNEELLKKMIQVFFEQHKKRWHSSSTPSMFNDIAYTNFFVSMLTDLAKIGKADLLCLKLDDAIIAVQVALLPENKCLNYNCSYDDKYKKQSPGIILHKMVFNYCVEHKLSEFDFLRGAEKYKLKLANNIRKNMVIAIHKNSFLYLLDLLATKAEKKIKDNELLYNFFIRFQKLRIF